MVWWDTDWRYKKSVTISGGTANYQMMMTIGFSSGGDVTLNSHCNTDFSDVRFIDSDEDTELPYWLESKTDSDNAVFWVKTDGADTIYIYYGNATATSDSDGDDTFVLFDDFPGPTLDATKWTSSGTITFPTASEVKCQGATGEIASINTYGYGYAVRGYGILGDQNTSNGQASIGFNNDLQDTNCVEIYSYRQNPTPGALTGYTKKDSVTSSVSCVVLESLNYRTFDVARNTTNDVCNFKVSTGSWVQITTNIPTGSYPCDLYVRNAADYVQFGWLLVRNYKSTEPSWSAFGSENESPALAKGPFGGTIVSKVGLPTPIGLGFSL